MNNAQKNEAKKFIEDTLELATGKSRDPVYRLWKSAEHSAQARAAYEILKKYEINPEKTVKDYKLKKGVYGGISADLGEIAKDMWIPEKLTKENWKDSFEIFNQDEYNCMSYSNRNDNYALIMKVLYCEDYPSKAKLGEKIDLFTNDSAWRSLAKNYATMILKVMNDEHQQLLSRTASKDDISLFSRIPEYTQIEVDSLKSIDLITKMYLSEMK